MAARLTAFLVAAIVGVSVVAGLIVGAQREDNSAPIDLVIYNGRVYTGDPEQRFAEALAIRGNKILRVGTNREIKRLRRLATTVVDAHGGSVLPGFAATERGFVSLANEGRSASATADSLPAPTDGAAPAKNGSADPRVTPAERRAASSDVEPDPGQPDPGQPDTGLPEPVQTFVQDAHRLGVTSLHTVLEGDADRLRFQSMWKGTAVPLRIVAALSVPLPVTPQTIASLDAMRAAEAGDPLLQIDAIALDAPAQTAQGTGTASRKSRGRTASPAEVFSAAVAALDKAGWPLVLRASDAAQLETVLDTLEQVVATTPERNAERHHVIALPSPLAVDAERLALLGVAVALPPPAELTGHGASVADAAVDSAGPKADEVSGGNADETLTASAPAADLGRVRLFVMNDTLADPRSGVQALVATQHPEPVDGGAATVPAKAVDANRLAAAIDAYTSTPAWAASDEHRRGRIAKDMLADIVILSADVFKLPADQLVDATVTMTIFDGKVVYDRAAEPSTTDQ